MAATPLPHASIQNDSLRVDYLTTTGPRIIGLYAKGVDGNLLAETPDIHWPTPHGEYYLYGGHRLWTAPEDPFYTCPEDHLKVINAKDKITLRSEVDGSSLQKEISFCLDKNRVVLNHRVAWHGQQPIELAAWAITQLRLGGLAILPQSDADGLRPNRSLIFWPYSGVHDGRMELHDDLILIHGYGTERAFKIGSYNPHGWVAYLLGHTLFVKRFAVDPVYRYPDMGCNVETYVKDTCLELETLGPLTSLEPNETMTYEEVWEITEVDYPATPENARTISRQLSIK